MTGAWFAALGLAAWFGLLTAISPCPMATNIAAIGFLGRRVANPRAVLLAGLLYTLGRSLAYLGVAMLAVWGLTSLPALSQFLQGGLNFVLGPILVVVGMLLVGLLELPWSLSLAGDGMQERVGAGWWWPLLLGVLFALSFCPVSAVLFFGSLVPLAIRVESPVAVPLAYGMATAIPVVVVTCILAFSAGAVGKAYNVMQRFAWWAQRITGAIFILVGIYLSVIFNFGVSLNF
jgi:cytochrome c-type biogenesis protein